MREQDACRLIYPIGVRRARLQYTKSFLRRFFAKKRLLALNKVTMDFSRRIFVVSLVAAAEFLPRAVMAAGPARPAPKIGVLLPLSGPDSLLGDECLRGVQLAVDAANGSSASRSRLSLVEGDASDGVAATAKALLAGGVNLLLGTGASNIAYPGSDAAELAQIPYVELNAPADGIMGRNFKYLIRTGVTTSMQAAVALQALGARFAGKKIGLLFNTGASAGAVAAAALTQWQAQKISPLLSIGYPEDVADLQDPVSRMRRAGVEVLVHAAGTDDVLVLFQAMQGIGWRPGGIIGCGDGYGFRETAFALGEIFEATYVSGAPFYPDAAAGIAGAYQARFGMPPRSADSLSSYVGAKWVFDALAAVNGDTAKLLDALRKTTAPAGTLANGWGVSFDKTGQNTAAFATLQQWRKGGLATVV
jgi:branched-chain amino acid transport system substrate-binding protein